MIYEITQGGILITIICFLIIWLWYRRDKKRKKEQEEQKYHKNLEISRKAKETARQMEEEKRKREEKTQKRLAELRTVEVYFTEEQNEKRKFCVEKSKNSMISENAIFMLYQVLHQPTVEKQEMIDLIGEGEGRYYNVFTLNKEDQERMEYCKKWLGVGETEVYAIGLEIYRQYLEQ
ncbi:MAG: KUP/HAK/KT family potassium transporter [Clostridiales bacterium]|nr:KUP/HAK/KT family potassium transporter [Clostridiales bacterium]